MLKVLLIMTGGGVGTLLRYLCSDWMQRHVEGAFPLGTFTVNVLGCFLIGLLTPILLDPLLLRPEYRLAVLVGVLGGFTTFSSFGWETVELAQNGSWLLALTYLLLSNAAGLAAVWLGYQTGRLGFGVTA